MNRLQVALGIIEDKSGKILLSKRNKGVHLEGYWEFPGGKVGNDESYKLALRRELFEELNIKVITTNKLFEFEYRYSDLLISFQVFRVSSYQGEAVGAERQSIQWVHSKDLLMVQLPPANAAIIDVLQLPPQYMIADFDVLQDSLSEIVEQRLREGISIIQLRARSLHKKDYLALADKLLQLCERYQARFIFNCNLAWLDNIGSNNVHLTSSQLKECIKNENLLGRKQIFSVACHNEGEIKQANLLGARCILLGAVNKTQSHPALNPLGWSKFGQLCCLANLPVYALGGVGAQDISTALVLGGQGVAGIRNFM